MRKLKRFQRFVRELPKKTKPIPVLYFSIKFNGRLHSCGKR